VTWFLVVVAALLVAAVLVYGDVRWKSLTRRLRSRLESARAPIVPPVVDFRELKTLPAPVQRYFRAALRDGAPMIAGVHVRHEGTFNMSSTADQWKPFTSDQRVVTKRPGFDWDARIDMAPGLKVRVHDAYVAGEGILHASLFGLFSVVDLHGTPEVAEGELMRFLAEAVWYPTSLLPAQGVRWEDVDERSARGTLTDGPITLTLLFTFNDAGLIETVRAEARGRTVGDDVIPTPWQGRFWNYQERDGMKVPLEGEVAWVLPEGPRPYWRGKMARSEYEFASSATTGSTPASDSAAPHPPEPR
jgi:hypothetical protein